MQTVVERVHHVFEFLLGQGLNKTRGVADRGVNANFTKRGDNFFHLAVLPLLGFNSVGQEMKIGVVRGKYVA